MIRNIHVGIFMVALSWSLTFSAERCVMTFSACPETFSNDTIVVPDKVVGISPTVLACKDTASLINKATPSFLFVIDNSGSMSTSNDRTGSRFTVTKDLLDTLFKKQPATEVGLVVFQEHLFFDVTSTQFYARYFKALPTVYDSQPNQAYVPFLTLNQNYNGLTGIQILDSILATNSSGSALRYSPSSWNPVGNTNINVAFLAAKDAFLTAKNPAAQQYIVFLSDGEPHGPWQAGGDSMSFTAGANLPTTFTVFFTPNGTAPQSLTTMTQNIKTNAYSTSNPMSALWTIQTSHDALLNLLLTNVISQIDVPAVPVQMILNNVVSNTYANGSFVFPDSFKLGTAAVTQYSMLVTYRYTNPTTHVTTDTTVSTVFYVRHSSNAGQPAGINFNCSNFVSGIPVTATLLDTSRDGHLDRIDITWSDTDAINPTLPTIAQWIQTLGLTNLDGTAISLHAVSIVPDLANKTIHIILNQNSGTAYETGWKSVTFTLTDAPVSVSGRPFTVFNIVDGAAPVIKSVCFVPGSSDTLRVIFSEPVSSANKPGSPNRYFSIVNTKSGVAIPDTGNPVLPQGERIVYVYQSGKLTDLESVKEGGRPLFALELCGDVPIVTAYHVASNPFIPGKTVIPPNQQDPNHPINFGTRIEMSLIPAVQQALVQGDVKATITIFDAVGNTILKNQEMSVDLKNPLKPKLFFTWDGKTTKGVFAGGGTYLGRTTLEDHINNKTYSGRQSIGVKQAK